MRILKPIKDLAEKVKSLRDRSQAVENWINNITTGRGFQRITSYADWFYTGVSITIPPNCIYGIKIRAIYNNSKAYGFGLGTSDTDAAYIEEWMYDTTHWFYHPIITSTGVTDSYGATKYVWAKYSQEADNSIDYDYWYIPISKFSGGGY